MKSTLFAIGEALIDFIPNMSGCEFDMVESFSPKIGGAPANVLGAFAKLGGKTQLITQLGDDPFGHKILNGLSGYGIGLENVLLTKQANTALAFVSLDDKGDRTFSFYRNPSADMLYHAENVDKIDFSDCYALHFCTVSLGDFPMKEAHKRAVEAAKRQGGIISFDPNFRPPLWNNTDSMITAANEFLPYADVVKVSDEEIEMLTGEKDIGTACREILKTAKLVICTCGADGAYAYTEKAKAFVPSEKVSAKDTTGAGDAFCGSLLYNLYRNGIGRGDLAELSGDFLQKILSDSSRYCAKSVQKPGAIESYPDTL